MLQLLIGFSIAVVIALTGVGAGVVTAPLLIIFLHVPVEIAVSTALAYAAVVKLIVVPVQMWRKQRLLPDPAMDAARGHPRSDPRVALLWARGAARSQGAALHRAWIHHHLFLRLADLSPLSPRCHHTADDEPSQMDWASSPSPLRPR